MAVIQFKGKPVHTSGELPAAGSIAPGFRLTRGDLSDAFLADFKGRILILNIVHSLDTSVCALSAKRFEQEIRKRPGLVVLTISRDLPFAQRRFCKAEGVENVVTLSDLRDRAFGKVYGIEMIDGPLEGLLARAIVVLDPAGKVLYTEQVPEISIEPDYDAALAAASKAV